MLDELFSEKIELPDGSHIDCFLSDGTQEEPIGTTGEKKYVREFDHTYKRPYLQTSYKRPDKRGYRRSRHQGMPIRNSLFNARGLGSKALRLKYSRKSIDTPEEQPKQLVNPNDPHGTRVTKIDKKPATKVDVKIDPFTNQPKQISPVPNVAKPKLLQKPILPTKPLEEQQELPPHSQLEHPQEPRYSQITPKMNINMDLKNELNQAAVKVFEFLSNEEAEWFNWMDERYSSEQQDKMTNEEIHEIMDQFKGERFNDFEKYLAHLGFSEEQVRQRINDIGIRRMYLLMKKWKEMGE